MTTSNHSTPKRTKTVDERIESLLADRKILLFRYDAHLRREIWQKLTALQRQLLNRISSTGIESLRKTELDKLLTALRKTINEHYADVSEFSQKELEQLLPIEVNATTNLYNQAVQFDLFNTVPNVTRQAAQSAQLIAGSPLDKWWQKQGNELAFKFEGLIRQGMLDGKQTSQLITEVKELMATSRRHSETLVRTAVMKVHDKAQELVRDENLDILKGEQQISTLDLRTSDVCQVRDGKAWDLDKKPIGDHDLPYQRPPLHPNCRSTMRLMTKSWRELGIDIDEIPESTRASMDGQVKQGLNYEDWLKDKTPEQQDQVLGKGKADLWRRGVITFRDMLSQDNRPLTLKELYSLSGMQIENNRSVKSAKWLLEKAEKVEPKITSDVIQVIDSVGGKVEGLEYRLKSLNSLERKIKTEMLAGISEQQAVDSVRDVVRYTAIFDNNTFVEQYQKMQEQLATKGYRTIVVKNTWQEGSTYKGVNTFVNAFVEKDNVIFEMQYHTQESFELKNGKLHQLYEIFRNPDTSPQEKAKISLEMQKLSANLKVPKDISLIKGKK